MPFKRLQQAREKTIGTKQTLKAIKKNQAQVVYVADNADKHVVEPVIEACGEKQVPLIKVDSMKNLGQASGIKVGCAAAAVIKD